MSTKQKVKDALSLMTKYIFNSVQSNGTWGESFDDDWIPITTALTVDYLLSCGFVLDNEWTTDREDDTRIHTLRDSIATLNSYIGDNFSFGEDVWDTCKFAIIIERHSLSELFPLYHNSKDSFISSLTERVTHSHSDWAGAGMVATAAYYLHIVGNDDECRTLLNHIGTQDNDGLFRSVGNYVAHPVWNTAQVVVCLSALNCDSYNTVLSNAIEGLQSLQDSDGTLKKTYNNAYFTAYAITGLSHGGKREERCCTTAIESIALEINDRNGHLNDYWATIMMALCFCDYLGDEIKEVLNNVKYNYIARSESYIHQLKQNIAHKEFEYTALSDKYQNAVSAKRFAIISMIATFVLFIASIVMDIIKLVSST
jgi:hypothetical protein